MQETLPRWWSRAQSLLCIGTQLLRLIKALNKKVIDKELKKNDKNKKKVIKNGLTREGFEPPPSDAQETNYIGALTYWANESDSKSPNIALFILNMTSVITHQR